MARPAFNVSDQARPAGRPGSSCISVHPIPWLDRIEASVMVEISAAARPMSFSWMAFPSEPVT